MRIPVYQSQVGIQNANGGRSADYQHPSAFASARDNRLPHDLDQLAKGLGALGGTMHKVGIERRDEIMSLDLLKTVQDRQAEMSTFMDNYMQEHRGPDAVDAETAFAEFGQEMLNEEMARWQGNARAQHFLQAQLGGLVGRGVDAMREYGNQQHERYKDSVFDREYQNFLSIANDWQSTPEEVRQAFTSFAPRLTAYYVSKGLDPTAAQLKAEDAYKDALNTNIFNRKLNDARMNPDEALRFTRGKAYTAHLSDGVVALADTVASEVGIAPDLLKSVVATESGGKADVVSPKGARGLMQLMPETQKELEAKYGISGDTPEGNMRLGALYLKELIKRYDGNIPLALYAYNWGMGNVDSYLKNGHGIKTITNPQGRVPAESQNYVHKVLGEDDELARQTLRPEQLVKIEETAQAEINSRYKAHEQGIAEYSKEVEKDGYALAHDGTLTRDWVEANRDYFSPAQYSKFLDMTRAGAKPPEHSNVPIYVDLFSRAVSGEDVEYIANEALRRGDITISDHRAILNESQQHRTSFDKLLFAERKGALVGSEVNTNPLAHRSFAQANMEFQNWLDSDEGGRATNEQKREKNNQIIDAYRVMDMNNSLLGVEPSLYTVGSRLNPDIKATAKAIEDAYKAGRLSDVDYQNEKRKLKRVADIVVFNNQQSME